MHLKFRLSRYTDRNQSFKEELVRNTDFGYNLSFESVWEISYGLKPLYVQEGRFIFKEGDNCNKIYFILDGKVDIYITINYEKIFIEELYRGCTLGSYNALSDSEQGISAKAVSHCNLFELDAEYVDNIAIETEDLKNTLVDLRKYVKDNTCPILDFSTYIFNWSLHPIMAFRWSLGDTLKWVTRINLAINKDLGGLEVIELLWDIRKENLELKQHLEVNKPATWNDFIEAFFKVQSLLK
jgi:hypothetical protein